MHYSYFIFVLFYPPELRYSISGRERERESEKREKDALVACRKLQASVNINFVQKEQVFRIRNFFWRGNGLVVVVGVVRSHSSGELCVR